MAGSPTGVGGISSLEGRDPTRSGGGPGTRRARLRAAMAEQGVAALLVTAPADVRWLTGFTGSAGVVYATTEGHLVLATDGRYAERAADELAAASAATAPSATPSATPSAAPGGGLDAASGLADPEVEVVLDRTWGWLVERHPGGTPLHVDAAHLPWAVVRELASDLTVEPVDGRSGPPRGADRPSTGVGIVEALRQVKDDVEVATLRRACAITDAAVAAVLDDLRPGMSEREVARRITRTMEDMGAEGPAFAPIVASGPNGSRPHHDPGGRVLERGDLITLDVGAKVDGYHADMTRTVALGEPDAALVRLHDLVRAAQEAGVAAARPGVALADLDRAARQPIVDAGHGEHYPHGLGHGVGLVIHETPFISAQAAGTLGARSTVTVEPGVYVPGLGGVRIEDVVLVTPAGAERLTTHPRHLIRL